MYRNTLTFAIVTLVTLTTSNLLNAQHGGQSVSLERRAELLMPRPITKSSQRLAIQMNMVINDNLKVLPLEGQSAKMPQPGSYWPDCQDGINARYNAFDHMSPSGKFQQLTNRGDITQLVSQLHGTAFYNSFPIMPSCTENHVHIAGRCIPMWSGICDGYGVSTFRLPAPRYPVVRNGIIFHPYDLKALGAFMFARSTMSFVGQTCLETPEVAAEIRRSRRDLDHPCMGIDAATLHLLITNSIGNRGQGLLMNLALNSQIWNYHVFAYKSKRAYPKPIEEAKKYYGTAIPFHPDIAYTVEFITELMYVGLAQPLEGYMTQQEIANKYVQKKRLRYRLDMNIDNIVIASEYMEQSIDDHPARVWNPATAIITNKLKKAMREIVEPMFHESAAPRVKARN